jgi:succinylglutamate desuccinylase
MIWDKKTKKRIVGLYGDFLSEKLLIIVAGIHGNEQSGILALEQVFHSEQTLVFSLFLML